MAGDSGRDGLRLQVGPPELGDPGPELSRIRPALLALPIPGPIPGPILGPYPAPRAASIARSSFARGPVSAAGPELISVNEAISARSGARTASRPASPP